MLAPPVVVITRLVTAGLLQPGGFEPVSAADLRPGVSFRWRRTGREHRRCAKREAGDEPEQSRNDSSIHRESPIVLFRLLALVQDRIGELWKRP
jgi:hypothetical protein